MKRYKLLKDLPYAKAGEVFERVTHKSEDSLSDYDYLEIKKRVKDGEDEVNFGIKYNYFLNNFDDWFEEILELTDSIHWEPKSGEAFWYIDADSDIYYDIYNEARLYHYKRFEYGNTYRTLGEAKDARNRRLAEVRLRRTSTFKPDFKNDRGGYVVFYNPEEDKLETHNVYCYDYGEIVRYETVEEAEKSIKENERDWKIYFGIKEEE
jgi:hypothetical protein